MVKPFFKTKRERPEQELQILLNRTRIQPLIKRGVLLDAWATPNELVGMLYSIKPWASQLAVKMGVLRGVPDFTLRSPCGKICWMELKSDEGTLSGPQVEFRERSKQAHFAWYEIRSIDDFDAAIKDWLGLPQTSLGQSVNVSPSNAD